MLLQWFVVVVLSWACGLLLSWWVYCWLVLLFCMFVVSAVVWFRINSVG